MALALTFFGTFDGLGYNVHRIEELSFNIHYNEGYADANFTFSATYNPILYPFYWLSGQGNIDGNFSMMYLPQSYERYSEWAPPNYGDSPKDRYSNYISYMISWGFIPNLLVLLILTATIEALGKRILYLALFLGMLGFSAGNLIGAAVATVAGLLAVVYVLHLGYSFPLTGLRGYILKRVFYSLLLVILIITVDFIIFMRMPSSPMDLLAAKTGSRTEEEKIQFEQEIRKLWGVDQPLLPQYFTYVRNLLTWNLGSVGIIQRYEQKRISLTQGLAERLPYTIFLLGVATLISMLIGVYFGMYAVHKRNGLVDKVSSFVPMITTSLPVWWIGLLFISFFGSQLRWFPYEGGAYPQTAWALNPPIPYVANASYTASTMQIFINLNIQDYLRLIGGYLLYAFLPLCSLILVMFGSWVLLTRAALLQTLGEDYLVTAKAKGVDDWRIITRHAFKNACLPLITSAAMSFSFVVVGSALVESVFRYPGIGNWLFEAVIWLDYPILMVVFYFLALCVIIANLIADLLYGLIDPRIRTG
ncbi:ABC transporter permease [Candidatus Bathyarchaeota archaeon]|nr:ABC transporter permease [Candidatus Bathyarchaeota archaeon]